MTKKYTQENSYILDAIDNSEYDDKPLKTPKDKLQFARETFLSEYGWRVKQVGELVALTDWLSGLPSSCNIEWRNNEIINLAIKWKRLPKNASDSRIDNYLEKWFRFVAMRLISLWKQNKMI